MSSRMTPTGQTINAVSYQDVGVIFSLQETSGSAIPASTHKMDVEMSLLRDSPTKISQEISAPNMRRIVMSYDGMSDFGRPYVTASIDSAIKDEEGKSTAFVCRVVLNPNP
jgi:hypothetical protein